MIQKTTVKTWTLLTATRRKRRISSFLVLLQCFRDEHMGGGDSDHGCTSWMPQTAAHFQMCWPGGPDGSLRNLGPSSSEAGGGGVHTFQHVPLLPWDRSWKCYTDPDVWAGSKHVKALIIKHPTVRNQPEQSYHYTAMIVWTRLAKHTHTQARATLMIVTYLKVAWKLAHYDNSSSQQHAVAELKQQRRWGTEIVWPLREWINECKCYLK